MNRFCKRCPISGPRFGGSPTCRFELREADRAVALARQAVAIARSEENLSSLAYFLSSDQLIRPELHEAMSLLREADALRHPFPDTPRPENRAVRRDEVPGLWARAEEVAQDLHTRAIDEIRITRAPSSRSTNAGQLRLRP